MDDIVKLLITMAVVLFGWLFIRGNITNNRIEAIRLEMSKKDIATNNKLQEKVKDLYEENKVDRKQHDCDMREIQKSIHSMTDVIRDEIRRLNIMDEPDVKEYVGVIFDPLKERFVKVEDGLHEVATQVSLLIERSK